MKGRRGGEIIKEHKMKKIDGERINKHEITKSSRRKNQWPQNEEKEKK